jgi:hypothetical protein
MRRAAAACHNILRLPFPFLTKTPQFWNPAAKEQKRNMDGTRHGGRWTRSGRGSCEIWSLNLGDLIRAQVTRGLDHPPTWSASINAIACGKHASRDAAMQTVEASISNQMRPTLGDWVKFQVGPRRPKG